MGFDLIFVRVVLKITEIFFSFQGEGILAGLPQVFLRLSGCNLKCSYCDTPDGRSQSVSVPQVADSIVRLCRVNHCRWVSLTGGEPLLQAQELKALTRILRQKKLLIYLETNGTLVSNLPVLQKDIDFVAMDTKLPSSTGCKGFWKEHRLFLESLLHYPGPRNICVKAIVTRRTTAEDIRKACSLVNRLDRRVPFIIQPASATGRFRNAPSLSKLKRFWIISSEKIDDVRVIPQIHRLMNWR